MTATEPKAKRSSNKRPAKRSVKRASLPKRKYGCPPLARPRDIPIDWSRCDAFLKLPLEERDRRLEAARAALGPAFADYSSDDFRRDQRREAERD